MAAVPDVIVTVRTYAGDEAKALMAQAHAYRRINLRMLDGTADGDPLEFVRACRDIATRAASEGA
jgi:hypothetical protein